MQCAYKHSGLLCGVCSPGQSLSLGSSRCLPCHANRPGVLVIIIMSSLLAGIVIVASLLMLNLNIAKGALNLMADLLHQYCGYKSIDIFFPSTSFVAVFVPWFNLELGIDTCFFDGMDFYWKTWI